MAEAAVVMQVKFPEGVSPEDDLAMLNDFVIPLAKAQVGFKNGTWAARRHGSRNGSDRVRYGGECQGSPRCLKPPAGAGPELISSDLYEVGALA